MTQAVIVVGQTFTVTLETQLANLSSNYSNHAIKYQRPDGKTGSLTPSIVGTTLVGTITPTINPLNGIGKFPGGYAGAWRFYPYVTGTGTVVYRGKTDKVIVSKEYQE